MLAQMHVCIVMWPYAEKGAEMRLEKGPACKERNSCVCSEPAEVRTNKIREVMSGARLYCYPRSASDDEE